MKCNQCGVEVDLSAWSYCPHCGNTLADEKLFSFFSRKKVLYSIFAFEIAFISFVGYMLADSFYKVKKNDAVISQKLSEKRDLSIDWKLEEEVFPIKYTGDDQKLLEVRISSEDFAKVKLETSVEGITSTETQVVNVKPGGNIFYLGPRISPEGYQKLVQSQRAMARVKISQLGQAEKEIINEKKEILFHSYNDIIWQQDGVDNSRFIVRLINKDDPAIKELVRKAADHMKELGSESNSMVGVFGDKEETKRQLEAIYLAMAKDYQVKYVASPFSYESREIQKVKTPAEVLSTKSGLCVELSLLVAAGLENLGLKPLLVLTNGHAWVGVEAGTTLEDDYFIETTLLEKNAQEASEIGQHNWELVKGQPFYYRLLKINELRSEGIEPIQL